MQESFHGVNVAALTPHRPEGHEVDLGAALDLIDYLSGAGVAGIALLGSTGEFPHLTLADRGRLVQFAAKRSRVPILAGVGHSTLEGALTLAHQAADSGAAGVLLMPPYFFTYDQAEVREFFLRFAERMGGTIPVLLYNIPFFTTPIAPETAVDLLLTGLFAGIKDSSGDIAYFEALLAARAQKPFRLLVGNDILFTRACRGGADGVISGVACAVPELLIGLHEAIRLKLTEKIDRLDARLREFIERIDRFPTPVGIKVATSARGLKVGPLAVPLSPEKQRGLEEFRGWFGDWLPAVCKEALEK